MTHSINDHHLVKLTHTTIDHQLDKLTHSINKHQLDKFDQATTLHVGGIDLLNIHNKRLLQMLNWTGISFLLLSFLHLLFVKNILPIHKTTIFFRALGAVDIFLT